MRTTKPTYDATASCQNCGGCVLGAATGKRIPVTVWYQMRGRSLPRAMSSDICPKPRGLRSIAQCSPDFRSTRTSSSNRPVTSTDRTASIAADVKAGSGTGSNIVPTPNRRGAWVTLRAHAKGDELSVVVEAAGTG